jgi:hypothetical protein
MEEKRKVDAKVQIISPLPKKIGALSKAKLAARGN